MARIHKSTSNIEKGHPHREHRSKKGRNKNAKYKKRARYQKKILIDKANKQEKKYGY